MFVLRIFWEVFFIFTLSKYINKRISQIEKELNYSSRNQN